MSDCNLTDNSYECNECKSLEKEIEELKAKLASAQLDSQRLNFLLHAFNCSHLHKIKIGPYYRDIDPRKAIDAAILESK